MGIFDNCLLISDIDGTLLEDGIIPESNIKAINEFKKEGGLFTVATGRGIPAIQDIYDKVGFNAPVIADQGSVVYDFSSAKLLFSKYLSESSKQTAIELINHNENIGIAIFSDANFYIVRENKGIIYYANYEHMEKKALTLSEALNLNWNKVVFMTESQADYDDIKLFYETIINPEIKFVHTMSYERNYRCLELYAGNINKGVGIDFLKSVYNKELFAIGDMFIDNELISASKYGAATKGAKDEVKKLAKYITCDVREGAVADYIRYIKSILRGS